MNRILEKLSLEVPKRGLRFVSSLQLANLVYSSFFPFSYNQRIFIYVMKRDLIRTQKVIDLKKGSSNWNIHR